MKDIIRITLGLTITCIIAGIILGAIYSGTEKAKQKNARQREQAAMSALLGYNAKNKAPADLIFHPVYRYIIAGKDEQYIGYLLPVIKQGGDGYDLLLLKLDGVFADYHQLSIHPDDAEDEFRRNSAIQSQMPDYLCSFADSFFVATKGKSRTAYLLSGAFPGFKTFIKVMIASSLSHELVGFEILESEEDPGLGGEIAEVYFKNQFKDKSLERIRSLKVIKDPLPEEYRTYLEESKKQRTLLSNEELDNIRNMYRDKDIYAITGATISSQAVTNGVVSILLKFAHRIEKLDEAVRQQKIAVSF
ncbi:MAG: FMN-binding protein [Pseudomonadota bacterium]